VHLFFGALKLFLIDIASAWAEGEKCRIINKIIENLKILVIFKLTSVLNILSICLYRNIL